MDASERAASVVPKLSRLSAEINGIAIVEWLHGHDRRTGRELYEWAEATFQELPLMHIACSTRDDVFEALAVIERKARAEGIKYVVQIEAHGCDVGYEGPGLAGAPELLHWEELRAPLVALNTTMRCNLVLVSAACLGARCTARLIKRAENSVSRNSWVFFHGTTEVNPRGIQRVLSRYAQGANEPGIGG